ncbi:MAG: hypothetical protein IPO92_18355 [Saprospiraceae bacterium]|nr:hypothetical protein [Saprospiraceae bacterium]
MKIIFIALLTLIQTVLAAQNQDIEIIEERGTSDIKLFALNNTEDDLDITLNLESVGFTSSTAIPVKKMLPAKAKELLIILVPTPNVSCEYKTSLSYKKIKKVLATSSGQGQKRRTTSIQMNTSKINVFTQDGCGRCEFVINYLEKNNIPYVELNTTIHEPNQELMFNKLAETGFKGNTIQMPVVIYKGKTDYDIKDLKKFVSQLQ